jgi:hypothetical protein
VFADHRGTQLQRAPHRLLGGEALGFAILMAVGNFFMWGSDWLGSALIEVLHIHFSTLVYINAATTLLAVPLALALLKVLLTARDNPIGTHQALGDTVPEVPKVSSRN